MANAFFRLLSWCPGALGLFLRQKIYPLFLGSCGRKVLFGRFTRLYGVRSIHIGENSVISDNVTLDARHGNLGAPLISIGSQVFIGVGSRLRTRGERIVIGRGSSLGSFCRIVSGSPVTLEEDVLLAAFCSLGNMPGMGGGGEIILGSGCWLGVRSFVLPGGRVGGGTVVGAHSLVRDSLPVQVVAVGRPARVLRQRGDGQQPRVDR